MNAAFERLVQHLDEHPVHYPIDDATKETRSRQPVGVDLLYSGSLSHLGELLRREGVMTRCVTWLTFVLIWVYALPKADAVDPPTSSITTQRTGTAQRFGSGTVTNRSDGSRSATRPFGSGSITTERNEKGNTIIGTTQRFGSGTITRWSNGTITTSRPFGSGSNVCSSRVTSVHIRVDGVREAQLC
jgi:hypothetical protein